MTSSSPSFSLLRQLSFPALIPEIVFQILHYWLFVSNIYKLLITDTTENDIIILGTVL